MWYGQSQKHLETNIEVNEDGGAHINIPTTITVNWTPFLTLFPLRLPANDIFGIEG